jgi:hypothetical protein
MTVTSGFRISVISFMALFAIWTFALSVSAEERELGRLKVSDLDLRLVSFLTEQETISYLLDIQRRTGAPADYELQRPVVFAINSPIRLVVDVPGVKTRKAHRVAVNDGVVKALRVGVHPNKMRLVIDLDIKYEPAFSVFQSGQDFYQVSFSTAESSASISLPPTPEPTPTAEPTPEPTPTPRPTATPTPIPTPEPTPDPTPEPTQQPTPEPTEVPTAPLPKDTAELGEPLEIKSKSKILRSKGPATLKQIEFKAIGAPPQPGLMLDLSRVDKYALLRIDRNIYELTLKSTKLIGDELLLPRFPPESFSGLELVSAREKGNDVVIRIYVGDYTRLKPFTKSRKLWLKVVPDKQNSLL